MSRPEYRAYWRDKVERLQGHTANPYATAHIIAKRHEAKVPRLRELVRSAAQAQVAAVDQALDQGGSEAAARSAAVQAFDVLWPKPRAR